MSEVTLEQLTDIGDRAFEAWEAKNVAEAKYEELRTEYRRLITLANSKVTNEYYFRIVERGKV